MKYLRMYCLSSCIVETHSEADIFKSGLGLLLFFFAEPIARHHWTKTEKNALRKQFKTNIFQGKTPCQLECLNAVKKRTMSGQFFLETDKICCKKSYYNAKTSNQKTS